MKFVPYLNFNGNASEAVELYAKAFNDENAHVMKYKDSNIPDADPSLNELVMHATVAYKDCVLMISDSFGQGELVVGNNLTLSLEFDDVEEMKRVYSVLSVGGKIVVEPETTFFATLYTNFYDQFGIGWQFMFESRS